MKESDTFRMLASVDRQLVLYELERADGPTTEEELACKVAARRHDISPEKTSDEEIERAHTRLVHNHIPLLLDLNVIEQNGDRVVLNDECRDQWLEAARTLDAWPPIEWVRPSTA